MDKKGIVPILYQDDDFIVFDKPAGLLVIPTPKNERRTLVNLVNEQYVPSGATWKFHPCHRLDRETSGVILFAKSKRNQRLMMDLFQQREIKKIYTALVFGRMQPSRGELRSRIRHLEQKKFRKQSIAKEAATRYNVIEEFRLFSLIEAEPITGRTNQIRIQFAEAGHPLVGERKYAIGGKHPLRFRRAALHARKLEWKHPVSGKIIVVESHLPNDMEAFIATHRN